MQFDTLQIRAAISLAGLRESDLAEQAGITKAALSNILSGKTQPQEETKRKILRKLEDLGIEFTPQSGVRKRSDVVQVFDGYEGQRRLNDDRFQTALNSSQDFLYCGAVSQEEAAEKLSAELSAEYSARMKTIQHFKMRGLRPMEDKSPAYSSHIQYRVMPLEDFPPVRFYVYGGKVAIMTFTPDFRVIIINDRAMSNDYRAYFEKMWAKALPYRGES
ncbi:MAG: helix-turn-helix domain-containing protein [Bdellovibrionales bacterium]